MVCSRGSRCALEEGLTVLNYARCLFWLAVLLLSTGVSSSVVFESYTHADCFDNFSSDRMEQFHFGWEDGVVRLSSRSQLFQYSHLFFTDQNSLPIHSTPHRQSHGLHSFLQSYLARPLVLETKRHPHLPSLNRPHSTLNLLPASPPTIQFSIQLS